MPRSLALTPQRCRDALKAGLGDGEGDPIFAMPGDWVVFYLFVVRRILDVKAWRPDPSSSRVTLTSHNPYVALLPNDTLTPIHFSTCELDLLQATPLHGDAIERRKRMLKAFTTAMRWLRRRSDSSPVEALLQSTPSVEDVGNEDEAAQHPLFSIWTWAATAYSSRAFPPSLVAQPEDERSLVGPVLLPGIDAFNHARGVPVTWTYPCVPTDEPEKPARAAPSATSDAEMEVAITLGYTVPANTQAFNCYGGKSNEEFLAGYGFVLDTPDLPDDTLTLVLGGKSGEASDEAAPDAPNNASVDTASNALSLRKPWGSNHYWRMGQEAPAGLLFELRERLLDGAADDAGAKPELEDSWLLKSHTATPSAPGTPASEAEEQEGAPSSSVRKAALLARRRDEARLAAAQLDGEVLETLEEMLCAKRKGFRAAQRQVDGDNGGSGARPEVLRMIKVYRRGQAMLLDHAVQWTRDQMDELIDIIETLEERVAGGARQ